MEGGCGGWHCTGLVKDGWMVGCIVDYGWWVDSGLVGDGMAWQRKVGLRVSQFSVSFSERGMRSGLACLLELLELLELRSQRPEARKKKPSHISST
jgi:hypothetical protein